jgi:hypothetical protein
MRDAFHHPPRVLMTAVEFTKDEAAALLQLIDLACKSGGLQVAEASAVLARKIAPAAQDTPQTEPKPDISPKE